ncbi:MAG: efflux RND transporter periplasmic adaptor subunit [Archangium sp.]|nr:efflux RND transporter periplasmic adaptor subunit [Archangium sp.]
MRVAVLVGLVALAACKKPEDPSAAAATKPQAAAPVKVETGTVQTIPVSQYLTLTGSVVADQQSEMAANVSGRVIATYVERGQVVKRGQAIALVDAQGAAFSASAAGSQAKAAEAQLALAMTDCERADRLFKEGAIAKSEYDRLKTSCSAQVFSAEAAKSNAGLASKLADDTLIRAPFDGVVGERYINVGEYVQPPTRVASLYAVNPVRVQISVPESSVGAVQQGQTVEVTVGAFENRVFVGKVRFVAPNLRPSTRDLLVEAVVPNADGALKPGMFATTRLVTGESPQATVPVDAIVADGTTKRLFLAKDNKAIELVVQTGSEKDGRVAVIDSLQPTDIIIVKPPSTLRDGAAILQ